MNMTLKEIAHAIAHNVEAVSCNRIEFAEFSARQHRLWRMVDRNEPCVIGSAASKRVARVNRYIKQFAGA